MKKYIVYTDGGCQRNPGGAGAYAAIIIDPDTGEIQEYTGGYRSTTNNRMEMMAVITALEHLPKQCIVKIHSDSQYVVKTMRGLYQKKRNLDLWKRMGKAINGKKTTFVWIKGHDNNFYNEKCDQMCTKTMAERYKLQRDIAFEKEQTNFAPPTTEQKNGAMGIAIRIPEEFSREMECLSAEEYAEKYHTTLTCAETIMKFSYDLQPNFKSYAALKTGGRDIWSGMKLDNLLQEKPELLEIYNSLLELLDEQKEVCSCIRWYCRGLPLYHAIRKILVDKEISSNCRKQY